MDADEAPREIPGFDLLERVAVGGRGEIYLARDRGRDSRLVAVKLLRQEDLGRADRVQAFVDEVQVSTLVIHPNVVRVYHGDFVEGLPYLVMEFVDGITVWEMLDRAKAQGEKIPVGVAAYITAMVADALTYAHTLKGTDGNPLDLVHRDVSTVNVMVTFDGAIKLLDFGIARSKIRNLRTAPGIIKGKLDYLSPEQCTGGPIDALTDIYSLGVVLFELLTCDRPYKETDVAALFDQVAQGDRPKVHDLRSDISPRLERIVDRAMATNRSARYQTAAEMLEDLRAAMSRLPERPTSSSVARILAKLAPDRVGAVQDTYGPGDTTTVSSIEGLEDGPSDALARALDGKTDPVTPALDGKTDPMTPALDELTETAQSASNDPTEPVAPALDQLTDPTAPILGGLDEPVATIIDAPRPDATLQGLAPPGAAPEALPAPSPPPGQPSQPPPPGVAVSEQPAGGVLGVGEAGAAAGDLADTAREIPAATEPLRSRHSGVSPRLFLGLVIGLTGFAVTSGIVVTCAVRGSDQERALKVSAFSDVLPPDSLPPGPPGLPGGGGGPAELPPVPPLPPNPGGSHAPGEGPATPDGGSTVTWAADAAADEPSAKAMGFLSVDSRRRAMVFVGRKRIGLTPVDRYELQPGRYRIKIRGRRGVRRKRIVIRAGEELQLQFSL